QVILCGDSERVDWSTFDDALPSAAAIICPLTERIDAPLLDRAPDLRVVGNCAVGLDNIDLGAARARGVEVCHTPGVLTDATADLAMALMLAASRRIVEAHQFVLDGRFKGLRADLLLGLELNGARLGVIGFGRIGQATAKRAAAFGMDVVYWSRSIREDHSVPGARPIGFDELLETSDVISLHVPLSDETRGLLNEKRIAQMKPGAVLVNTARGPVVDESALAEALASGHLMAAGLDVFENEPAVHPRLLGLDNVVLAPHIGSATRRTRERMTEMVCRDVLRVLSGEQPKWRAPFE
ncbi:MAG: D-glycerate dehydrogenase, partial [Myxococcales bacterium]|nr:D-glycerate dehydrogenase [Myxococcales bacterium]